MSEHEAILDRIHMIRMANNDLWMRLLAIALDAAPGETKSVLKSINENDAAISGLLKELAK